MKAYRIGHTIFSTTVNAYRYKFISLFCLSCFVSEFKTLEKIYFENRIWKIGALRERVLQIDDAINQPWTLTSILSFAFFFLFFFAFFFFEVLGSLVNADEKFSFKRFLEISTKQNQDIGLFPLVLYNRQNHIIIMTTVTQSSNK